MALEWVAATYQKDLKLEVNPLGTEVSQLYSRPPRGSQASWWISSAGAFDAYLAGGGNLFNIQCGIGTIIDFECEYLMIDDESQVGILRAMAGASTGKFYYSPLDVTSTGTGNLVAQAVNTI